ncbi:hypothetical protein SAMD00023353_1201400 [Rosellinia necatrix]|uniref:Uncharacterized protein n=1 Tax=Rosellinia necatrix TaxID=77044 RepID=A0A1W2TKD6_ROSNE|nr:hypothetical protein SAMD00023353_1201400 [Rosellinia necatrix]
MALPLSLHHDEDRSVLMLTDSEDDDLLPPSRQKPNVESKPSTEAMRQKTKEAAANVPVHPIPAMQPAFAESLMEATNNGGSAKPKLRFGDAKQRRAHLLDARKGAGLYADAWRYRPGQRHHELWKLLAQVSFGVYLLLNGIANSNEQVVDILQNHIDEVDEFLETTLEDVNTGIDDVRERIEYLRLPMENMTTFEEMLEDRDFRLQIVNGNDKIEHIIDRTNLALNAIFKDADEGLKGVKAFAVYLEKQKDEPWRRQRPEFGDIYEAMKGNAQGWYQALTDIQEGAESLDTMLTTLGEIVVEMNQTAGEVSRRTRHSVAPFSGAADPLPAKAYSRKLSPPSSQGRSSAPHSPPKAVSQVPRPDSPAEKEVVFFEEKEVAFVHPVNSTTNNAKPELQVPAEEDGVYLLQPRTYTPQPPAPLPSPRVKNPPAAQSSKFQDSGAQGVRASKRTSLRQRVSLKGGNLPEVIHVPPVNVDEMASPTFQSPQYQRSPLTRHGRDSEYVSGLEVHPSHQSPVDHHAGMSVPKFTNTIPSPRSDQQQYFYPVRASPHSPLQQRPHTSATARPHTAHAGHVREQRSAMGMSMLSNVATADGQDGKKLKKKKSAFGWLKKAFTLDDEEREEFRARKQQQALNPYYEARSPKFLDGKRLPDPRRVQPSSRSTNSRM